MKEGPLVDVIGVAADTRQQSLTQRVYPVLYEVALEDAAFQPFRALARTAVTPASLFQGVRSAVRRVDPDQPVANLRTLEEMRTATVAGRQLDLSLVALFTVMALILAAVGSYGLLAQSLAQTERQARDLIAQQAADGSWLWQSELMAHPAHATGGAAGHAVPAAAH